MNSYKIRFKYPDGEIDYAVILGIDKEDAIAEFELTYPFRWYLIDKLNTSL